MAIHKPALSVKEARRLAVVRSSASQQMANAPADGERTATGATSTSPLVEVSLPPRKQAAAHKPASTPQAAIARPKKIQVFVSAYIPAPKVSPVFDILSRQYPPHKSLQMILRRALADYEEMLEDGSFQQEPDSYALEAPTGSMLVQTSHMMPKVLLTLARAHFDPLGLESSRAFGLKLATAALAAFFSREVKRRS
ncbi:VirC2 family conjugal transfer protein [Rhizobium ruizarguesonis]